MADTALAALPVRRASRAKRARLSLQGTAYALSAPALFFMLLFLLAPLAIVLLLSFTDYQLGAASLRVIGLGNYAEMAWDPTFQKSLRNTLLWVWTRRRPISKPQSKWRNFSSKVCSVLARSICKLARHRTHCSVML